MRKYLGPAAVALSLVVLTGCAARRMVESSARPAARGGMGATIESSDQRLAAALIAESLLPTAENHLQVGAEYQRLGILDFAQDRVERALARAPRLPAAHEAMARLWRDLGMPESGLGYAHRATYYGPRSASAQNTLGTILDAMGRFDEARKAYAGALALDPSAAWALNNLCYLEFRLGHFREARRHCEAAVQLSPALGPAHNNLALAHAAVGDLIRARDAFFAAGDHAAAHYNLGVVFLARGQYIDAALAFEEAIKARPSFTAAKARAHGARMRVLTNR